MLYSRIYLSRVYPHIRISYLHIHVTAYPHNHITTESPNRVPYRPSNRGDYRCFKLPDQSGPPGDVLALRVIGEKRRYRPGATDL